MADTLHCPECGKDIESMDDLEKGDEIVEIEVEDDGSINLFEHRDTFLCAGCRKVLATEKYMDK